MSRDLRPLTAIPHPIVCVILRVGVSLPTDVLLRQAPLGVFDIKSRGIDTSTLLNRGQVSHFDGLEKADLLPLKVALGSPAFRGFGRRSSTPGALGTLR